MRLPVQPTLHRLEDLSEPLPALGGVHPGEPIDTYERRQLVSSVLAKIQSGAYA